MLKDKKELAIKVIQFGEGNFLRAFVDWMIQQMNDQNLFNGQVAVVQPLPNGLVHMLEEQNCNYTHYLKGIKDNKAHEEHYINTSIQTTVNPYESFQKYLDLAKIDTANIIVSNTTEAGITVDKSDRFNDDANVTYPAKLTRLLFNRFSLTKGSQGSGYLIMPCELIDNNGDQLKDAVLTYTDLWDLPKEFKTWIEKENTFCNTLVDRIVPGFPKNTIKEIWKELDYEDNLLVESELFNLWVVEGDESINQLFPAKEAGCNFLVVDDVTPFKKRKVRILNGAHTSLVPVAYLAGKETVRESVMDAELSKYLQHVIFKEIIPTLTLSKEELESFAKEVLNRFKNPFVKHYLISISLNSMSKYKTRVLPSLTAYLDQNQHLPKGLCAALAALIVFYRGQYNNQVIPLKDTPEVLALTTKLWSDYDDSYQALSLIVEGFLSYTDNWQADLNTIPGLTELVTKYAHIIINEGIPSLLTEIGEVI